MSVLISFLPFFLLTLLSLPSASTTVSVSTQEQFDAVVQRINNGEKMDVTLSSNTFVLKTQIKANSYLHLEGKNSTITCFTEYFDSRSALREDEEYYVFSPQTTISPYSLFYDKGGNIIDVVESVDKELDVNLADGIIADNDMSTGSLVKIPIPRHLQHLKNRVFDDAFGYFDCGWQVVKFLLEKSDKEFFYCKTLERCRTGNYSFDKSNYKKPIRFVIYNAEKKPGAIFYDKKHLYIPKTVGSVYLLNSSGYISSTPNILAKSGFSMKGVRFIGYGGVEVNSKASVLCEIIDCQFKNCLGCALKITRQKDSVIKEAIVKNCTFTDCSLLSGDLVTLESPFIGGNFICISSCSLTRYSDNRVTYKNPAGAIWVRGNATVLGNEVYNTPRCHLYFNGGVIEAKGNVLYNTDEFNTHTYRNLSSDWGLIYCNHVFSDTKEALDNKIHRILLENNFLYGAYTYGNAARGIYIDNGRGDVECRNNIILNTQSYSIDSRNVSLTDASSVRNRYFGNIATSRYQLVAGPAVRGNDVPIISGNILLDAQDNVTRGVKVAEQDSRYDQDAECYFKDGRVMVSRALYKKLKRSPAWRSIKKHVGKK